jgi:hypothetical protein
MLCVRVILGFSNCGKIILSVWALQQPLEIDYSLDAFRVRDHEVSVQWDALSIGKATRRKNRGKIAECAQRESAAMDFTDTG